jgi:Cu-processing system permease protein
MTAILVIAGLTLREAHRRRILLAAAVLGLAFVGVYTFGLWFILSNAPCGTRGNPCASPIQAAQARNALSFLTLAGLYCANFLTVIAAVLLPVDTLSGEIGSGVTQTLASKPIRRSEILVGKWLAYWLMMAAYLCLTAGGVLIAVWAVNRALLDLGPALPPGLVVGLPLVLLEATLMLTVSIAGGTRFSTVANGIVAFGLFGIAFLGGWIEEIGEVVVQTQSARTIIRDIGTVVSLVNPSDALWRLAAYHMIPPLVRDLGLTPFTPLLPPTGAVALWAVAYLVVVFAIGLRQFERRPL